MDAVWIVAPTWVTAVVDGVWRGAAAVVMVMLVLSLLCVRQWCVMGIAYCLAFEFSGWC